MWSIFREEKIKSGKKQNIRSKKQTVRASCRLKQTEIGNVFQNQKPASPPAGSESEKKEKENK